MITLHKRVRSLLFIFTSAILTFIGGALFFIISHQWVDFAVLEHYNPGKASRVLDDHDNELFRYQLDRRSLIELEKLPPCLINAFLATEDHDFFSHHGISLKGAIRSLFVNIYHRRIVQGASTITQQLAKLLFFEQERTFSRKIKEQFLALIIEYQCTKEHILEIYLNHIYFGCGIYGVEAASQRFWGISAQDVTPAQAATLAGIVKSPRRYCPLLNAENSLQRRNLVLGLMVEQKMLSEEDYYTSRATDLALIQDPHSPYLPIKEMLRSKLEDIASKKALYTEGLTIKTTFNQTLQDVATTTFKQHITQLRSTLCKTLDGGLIIIDPHTGAIKALIGGYDQKSYFNRATQSFRQMGSIFKPLIYAEALRQGMSLEQTEIDEPISVMVNGTLYCPQNSNKKCDYKPLSLAQALARSKNTIALKTLLKVGYTPVIQLAQACKLPGIIHPYPSLALGCTECAPIHAAGMFAIFANGGIYNEPYSIEWIKDQWGKKIWKQTLQQERVLDKHIAQQITQALMITPQKLAQKFGCLWPAMPCILKTGTTNDSRTFYLTVSSPDLTTALYLGTDTNAAIPGNYLSIHTTLPLWMKLAHTFPPTTNSFTTKTALLVEHPTTEALEE